MTTPELKPCPFCGKDAKIAPDEIGSGGQHVPPYHAGCFRGSGCGIAFTADDPDEAIAEWNRRTLSTITPAAPEGEQEAVVATDYLRGQIGEILCLELDADESSMALSRAVERILALTRPAEHAVTEDDVAARLWKAEAEDAGAPASLAAGRTRAAFDEQSAATKARWRKFAKAAMEAGHHD